jgi:hypothetical protein
MDYEKVALVVCLTALIVVGINATLFVMLRRGKEAGQVELLRRAAQRARRPWGQEEADLAELSRRVAELRGRSEPVEGAGGRNRDDG